MDAFEPRLLELWKDRTDDADEPRLRDRREPRLPAPPGLRPRRLPDVSLPSRGVDPPRPRLPPGDSGGGRGVADLKSR
jgi:hypothetical protein